MSQLGRRERVIRVQPKKVENSTSPPQRVRITKHLIKYLLKFCDRRRRREKWLDPKPEIVRQG